MQTAPGNLHKYEQYNEQIDLSLQQKLIDAWTHYLIPQFYQNLFLKFIKKFTAPHAEAYIRQEIKSLKKGSNLIQLFMDTLEQKRQIQNSILLSINKQNNKQRDDINVLNSFCNTICKLRQTNYKASYFLNQIKEIYQGGSDSKTSSERILFHNFAIKLDNFRDKFARSPISDYLALQKNYDPFFMSIKDYNTIHNRDRRIVQNLSMMTVDQSFKFLKMKKVLLNWIIPHRLSTTYKVEVPPNNIKNIPTYVNYKDIKHQLLKQRRIELEQLRSNENQYSLDSIRSKPKIEMNKTKYIKGYPSNDQYPKKIFQRVHRMFRKEEEVQLLEKHYGSYQSNFVNSSFRLPEKRDKQSEDIGKIKRSRVSQAANNIIKYSQIRNPKVFSQREENIKKQFRPKLQKIQFIPQRQAASLNRRLYSKQQTLSKEQQQYQSLPKKLQKSLMINIMISPIKESLQQDKQTPIYKGKQQGKSSEIKQTKIISANKSFNSSLRKEARPDLTPSQRYDLLVSEKQMQKSQIRLPNHISNSNIYISAKSCSQKHHQADPPNKGTTSKSGIEVQIENKSNTKQSKERQDKNNNINQFNLSRPAGPLQKSLKVEIEIDIPQQGAKQQNPVIVNSSNLLNRQNLPQNTTKSISKDKQPGSIFIAEKQQIKIQQNYPQIQQPKTTQPSKEKQQKKQIKIKLGKMAFNSLKQYVNSYEVHSFYSSIYDIKKILKQTEYQQSYVAQFTLNNEPAALALSSIVPPHHNFAIRLWIVNERVEQSLSINLFKKYIELVQKNIVAPVIYFKGKQIEEMKNAGFQLKKENLYSRGRTTQPRSIDREFQNFLYCSCSQINFPQKQKEDIFVSQQIQKFTNHNSLAAKFLFKTDNQQIPQNLKSLFKLYENISSFAKVNEILQEEEIDGYEINQSIAASSINLSCLCFQSSIGDPFTACDGFFKFYGIEIINEAPIQLFVINLTQKNGKLYFGRGFQSIPHFANALKGESNKRVCFYIPMFSKNLYGRYGNISQKSVGLYANWQFSLVWQDQMQGLIKHQPSSSVSFIEEAFYVGLQIEESILLSFHVSNEDLIF